MPLNSPMSLALAQAADDDRLPVGDASARSIAERVSMIGWLSPGVKPVSRLNFGRRPCEWCRRRRFWESR